MAITPFNGNLVKPIVGKPLAWEALPDLHLLAVKILAQHKVIPARLSDINEALDNPGRPYSIEGGSYVLPPFCVWGLPRSDRGKGQLGGGEDLEAPRLWFLGAPLLGVKAAGLSHDFSESVAKADDPRWTAKAMQYIHHRGGYVYGGQWSTVRWAQGRGVDTSDFQRIAEYAMDQLAVADPLFLTSWALGSEPARVQIKSLREARRLITGIWSTDKDGTSAEDQRAAKFLVLNRLAHPEFAILTTAHRGQATLETLTAFSLFSGVTEITGPRGAQGWELTLSPVAVALGIGMASRLGRLVSDGQKAFDPERVAVLLGWLNQLKESERRLARHLLLSQGDRDGYIYLREPYYAAAVLGHRLTDDRRTRERIASSLEEAGLTILEAVKALDCIPAAQAHLVRALESIGIGTTPRTQGAIVTGLGFDLDEPVVTAPNAHDGSREATRPPQMRDTTAPNARTGLPQMRAEDRPKCVTRPPQMRDTTAPNARHDESQHPDLSACSAASITSSTSSTSIQGLFSQVHITGSPQFRDSQAETDRPTDRLKINSLLTNNKNQEEPSPDKTWLFPSGDDQERNPYLESVLLGPPSEKSLGRLENRLRGWPRPLFQAVAQMLSPAQLSRLEGECRWTAEGVWAIYQEILVKGARLQNPAGTLWNALIRPEKGAVWMSCGPALRDAGWFEVAEDATPLEAAGRRVNAGRLAPFRRLPLDEAGLVRRQELLREAEAKHRLSAERAAAALQSGEADGPASRAWHRVAEALAGLVPQRSFNDWVVPCYPVSLVDGQLTLHVGNQQTKRWIEEQMINEFYEAVACCGLDLQLRFIAEA